MILIYIPSNAGGLILIKLKHAYVAERDDVEGVGRQVQGLHPVGMRAEDRLDRRACTMWTWERVKRNEGRAYTMWTWERVKGRQR
jgi:hypothetical protein